MEKDLEDEILKLTAEFEKTIPKEESEKAEMIEAFKKYLQDTVKTLQESKSKFINKSTESIKEVLKRRADSIGEYDLDSKKSELLEDEAFEEIRKISSEIYENARNKIDGKREKSKIDTEAEIEKMNKLLENVKGYNQEQAKKFISEAIVDSRYITSGNEDILSFRLYHYKEEKDNKEEER